MKEYEEPAEGKPAEKTEETVEESEKGLKWYIFSNL